MIKQRMIQEKMQEQAQGQAAAQSQQNEMEDALKKILPQILDDKARERLNNIKIAKPELAMQMSTYLVQLFQSGQVKEKINEEQLISILNKLNEKKEITIKRK